MGHGPALRIARDALEVAKPKAQSWQSSPTATAPIQPADAALYLLAVAGLGGPMKPIKSTNSKRNGRLSLREGGHKDFGPLKPHVFVFVFGG